MNRIASRFVLLILPLVGIASTANAHHPPRFERCQMFTFTGQIERIEWANPHVQLFIRTDDGETHQMGWLSLQALHRAGIEEDTLHAGDRVEVEGGFRSKDAANEPLLLSKVHRTSDGWEWSQPIQGC
jgi:Family of unknown function (DUF6152)